MDFSPSLGAKNIFRFTGPPENWLTAIKFMTWGLENKYLDRWKEIQTGDIFFIHSTGPQTSLFKNAKSGIIGLGVVGSNFSIKDKYLWIHEHKDKINKWPLLVPFSEIYLFSKLPDPVSWKAPDLDNIEDSGKLVSALLQNYIPLSEINGFPQMGSFSAVSREAAKQILFDKRPLYVYSSNSLDNLTAPKSTKLEIINNAAESMRYADTLQVFDNIEARIIREKTSVYSRNNELLSKAEKVHYTILQSLIDIFRSKGYDTRFNKFVDLFAYNKDRSYLFEIKSTENTNFRSQARKGLIQLFEYDYFEVRKFVSDKKLSFKEKYNILVPSKQPSDGNYVNFINDFKVGVALVENETLKPVGKDFGFSQV
jgi:hypothetical protein